MSEAHKKKSEIKTPVGGVNWNRGEKKLIKLQVYWLTAENTLKIAIQNYYNYKLLEALTKTIINGCRYEINELPKNNQQVSKQVIDYTVSFISYARIYTEGKHKARSLI